MTTARVESLPATWDDARDVPFFRLTAHLFTPELCFGGTVLLASYDEDLPDTVRTVAAERGTVDATAAALHRRPSTGRDHAPAQVRRIR